MSDVTSEKWPTLLFKIYLVSEKVQAYPSKIILYFQLQNNEYFYSGVTIVLGLQAPSPNLFI